MTSTQTITDFRNSKPKKYSTDPYLYILPSPPPPLGCQQLIIVNWRYIKENVKAQS